MSGPLHTTEPNPTNSHVFTSSSASASSSPGNTLNQATSSSNTMTTASNTTNPLDLQLGPVAVVAKKPGRLNQRVNSNTSQLTNSTTFSGGITSNSIHSQNNKNHQHQLANNLASTMSQHQQQPPPPPSPSNLKLNTLYRKTTNAREIRNQKKLTTTLIIILCLLLICYMPSFLFEESLANAIFGNHEQPSQPDTHHVIKIKSIGYRISFLLIYINCSANFLIYCFCNKKFKNSLKLLIRKSCLNRAFQRIKLLFKSSSGCLCCLCCDPCRTSIMKPNVDTNSMVLYQLGVGLGGSFVGTTAGGGPSPKMITPKNNSLKNNNSNNSNLELA